MTLNQIKNTLTDFSKKNNLQQKALKSCQVAMLNCIEDDIDGLGGLGGFKIEEIRLEFIRQEVIFEHYSNNTPFVKTRIGLYKNIENDIYFRNLEPVGYYELDTNLDGESFDDWLIIDKEKNNQLDIIYDLKELNKVLPEQYLRRNSIYYEYISYVAHIVTHYQAKNLKACLLFMQRAFKFSAKIEIKDDFEMYYEKSKKYIKRIASYLDECGLIEKELIKNLEDLEILKAKSNKL